MMKNSLTILHEDDSIIVIHKPRGLAVQSAKSYEKDVVSLLKEYLGNNRLTSKGQRKEEPYVGVIHRLDQPVEGIVVFAKNKNAAANLSKQVQGDSMNKHYTALVEGKPDGSGKTELRNLIYKDSKAGKAVIVNENRDTFNMESAKAKEAVLKYNILEYKKQEDVTAVEVELITGRFHQIRAQFSAMGHPVVGDRRYGSSKVFSGGIALTADRLTFVHPKTGKKTEFVINSTF